MRLCCEVSAQQNINITFRQSTKGAMMAGGCALLGGLLGGPPGIAVGKNRLIKPPKHINTIQRDGSALMPT